MSTDYMNQYPMSTDEMSPSENKPYLRCAVCDAKANGYNFDRITCESCKAFFRRNALKHPSEFRCRFGRFCLITAETRRHCTACRIKKCFAVGMRKEWIQRDQEKIQRRTNDKKSKGNVHQPRPTAETRATILSAEEEFRIEKVIQCYEKYVRQPNQRRLTSSFSEEPLQIHLHDYFNRQKPMIIDLINYVKHLPEYEQVHLDDQVLLIKFNIRYLLPINHAVLQTPHSDIHVINNPRFHSFYQTLCDSFIPLVSTDSTMMQIFLVVLFYTVRSDLFNADRWKTLYRIQSSYIELFWSYLVDKWGEEYAIRLSTNLVSYSLRLQTMISQIDQNIGFHVQTDNLDSVMKIVLQLS